MERFAAAGVQKERISFQRDTSHIPAIPVHRRDWLMTFRKYYGPTMNAFEAAEKNGRAGDLQKELEALFVSQNQNPGPEYHRESRDLPARDR